MPSDWLDDEYTIIHMYFRSACVTEYAAKSEKEIYECEYHWEHKILYLMHMDNLLNRQGLNIYWTKHFVINMFVNSEHILVYFSSVMVMIIDNCLETVGVC